MIKVSTSQYEGPLDLLLSLIEKKKIDILDINLKDITDDYLKEIVNYKYNDVDNMADFLYIASTLVEIKSRSLLPIEISEDEEETDLLERLIEYKKYKVLTLELKEKFNQGLKRFYKYPEDLSLYFKDEIIINTDKNLLFQTLIDLVNTKKKEDNPLEKFDILHKEEYSVDGQMNTVRNFLKMKGSCEFLELIKDKENINELITSFLAVLELIRNQFLIVDQKENTILLKICGENNE